MFKGEEWMGENKLITYISFNLRSKWVEIVDFGKRMKKEMNWKCLEGVTFHMSAFI